MKNDVKNEMVPAAKSAVEYAMEKGATPEQLSQLLTIQERWEANEARKAYNEAMTAFKADPPKIEKDKSVSFGQGKASYRHASLANVTDKINAALSKHGLSASWRTVTNGVISVTTRISHVQGHFEETTLSAPADNSGSKNAIQAIGSTVSYLQRYGLLALTGLATSDQDDDAQTAEVIDSKQLNQLLDMAADKGVDLVKFCAYMRVDDLCNLPKVKFAQALEALKAKVKK